MGTAVLGHGEFKVPCSRCLKENRILSFCTIIVEWMILEGNPVVELGFLSSLEVTEEGKCPICGATPKFILEGGEKETLKIVLREENA